MQLRSERKGLCTCSVLKEKHIFPAEAPAAQWVNASTALLEAAVAVRGAERKGCASLSLPVAEGKSRIPGTGVSRSILFCQGTFFHSPPRCFGIRVLPGAVRGSWPESVSAKNHLSEPLHPSASLGTLVAFWGCEFGWLFEAASGPARESEAL